MQAELGLSGSNAQHVYFTKDGEEVRESSTASAVFNQAGQSEGAGVFYSQLARAIDTAKQSAMPADQWASWLNSNAAKMQVKAEEIQ
ncbi:hypothetical protein M3M33_15175, partial [Loigolactobacillus coryniformis]|uniref:hypothetical protein n=1 Tax=Loigolactobacillus coryniformis TaxID=1610 RepID=UPI00201A6B48